MGSWLGHAAPGTFFIGFAVWWLIRSLCAYYSNPDKYTANTQRSCCCKSGCMSRVPLDSWLIVVAATTGVIMEIITGAENPGGVQLHNWQHVAMYAAFGTAAAISLLIHYNVQFVPKGADYMAYIMALAVELVLFAFHLHGRPVADVHIHMLLVYTIAACVVTTAIELYFPHSINATISRCYTMIAQGTWFHQIAYSLYSIQHPDSPGYKDGAMDLTDPENVMVLTLMYAWHLIGIFIAIFLLSGLVYCMSSAKRSKSTDSAAFALLPNSNTTDSKMSKGSKSYNVLHSDEETECCS